MKQNRKDYTGRELSVPRPVTWRQVEPGLPRQEFCGCVRAEEVAEGGVRELLLNPQLVLKPRAEWPAGRLSARCPHAPGAGREIAAGL